MTDPDSYAAVLDDAKALDAIPGAAESAVHGILSRLLLLDDSPASDLKSPVRRKAVGAALAVCLAIQGRAIGKPGDSKDRAEQQLGQLIGLLRFLRAGGKAYDRAAQERAMEDYRVGRYITLDEFRRRLEGRQPPPA